ncbi:MAG TPA: ankyrin repeat domain-containing protein [Anaerolineales bacterium]|nr:ankyrin repeat domain-containing protein [Anaerolineales bacterium]
MSAKFFEAIKNGDRTVVESMIAEDPRLLHATDLEGLSPILLAAYNHRPEIAEILADHTVTLSIFEAAATGKYQQMVMFIAKSPELANAYAQDGYQPLGLAAFCGHVKVVDFLLKAGAWPNSVSRSKSKATPLHSAVSGGYIDIAYRLLEAGADPNVQQVDGLTPLHYAAQNGQVDMIRILLEYGANLPVQDKNGKTALDLATEKGHKMAAMLLRSGITKRFRKVQNLS